MAAAPPASPPAPSLAGFHPSPAVLPPTRALPVADPRWLELRTHDPATAHLNLAGVPFDGAVIGRKGAAGGPTAIREAMRWLSTYDPDTGTDLAALRWCDLGDVRVDNADVLAAHRAVTQALTSAFHFPAPLVILGGDNSLSTPNVEAMHKAAGSGARIGLVVLDAHYDLRPVPESGIPSSGTPYRRLVEAGIVAPQRLVEIGIRPYANTKSLVDYAAQRGIHIVTRAQLAQRGAAAVAQQALALAGAGATHLFVSVDIDGLDQSIAPGVSAPGAGGMWLSEVATIVTAMAADPRCRGMDVVEVAPNLDLTGNTARVAAQVVAAFAGGVMARASGIASPSWTAQRSAA